MWADAGRYGEAWAHLVAPTAAEEEGIEVDSGAIDDTRRVVDANGGAKVGGHDRVGIEVGRAAHIAVDHVMCKRLRSAEQIRRSSGWANNASKDARRGEGTGRATNLSVEAV